MHKLIWQMGLPMIVSMILQSVSNIVDTAFVINMGEDGIAGNLALTYAFPSQLLIIAIGVGTGVGINALLSRKLGEKDTVGATKTVGNGIFLGICIAVQYRHAPRSGYLLQDGNIERDILHPARNDHHVIRLHALQKI